MPFWLKGLLSTALSFSPIPSVGGRRNQSSVVKMSSNRAPSPPPGSWSKRARTPGEVKKLEEPSESEVKEGSRSRRKRKPSGHEGDRESRRHRARSDPGKASNPKAERANRSRSPGWRLGKTEGMLASGAWAARAEIANMLEFGIDADTLLKLLKSGKEGSKKLPLDGGIDLDSDDRRGERSPSSEDSRSAPPDENKSVREVLGDMSDEEWKMALAKQKSILESLSGVERPPWTKASPVQASASRLFPVDVTGVSFVKNSKPPPPGARVEKREPENAAVCEPKMEEEKVEFRKPVKTTPPEGPAPPPRYERRGVSGMAVYGMEEKEFAELERFHTAALELYHECKDLGVKMDLSELVEPSGVLDEERFRLHTRPNKAATGLNYVRLMRGLMKSAAQSGQLPSEKVEATGKLGLVGYVEHLVHSEVGFLTPRSLLYAVEFFSKAFGFEVGGSNWDRCKRLSLRYAQSKPAGTNRAEAFCKSTIAALEYITLDAFVSRPQRIACGKLRLCIQASMRYDDLLNTPLGCCEWTRKPGSDKICGLRARAKRGKCGPRLWVASNRGVTEDTDGWLDVLMKLLLESHGKSWEEHDHTGKLAAKDEVHFTAYPSQMGADVALVKKALSGYADRGEDPGVNSDELDLLRWHGAKSTFTSIMQHINVPRHAVRFAGDWAAKEDAMPDVYMREAQIMVLMAQERVINYLRAGGDLFRLRGEKIGGETQDGSAETREAEEKARIGFAMDGPTIVNFAGEHLAREFLDPAFNSEGKFPGEFDLSEERPEDLEEKASSLLFEVEEDADLPEVDVKKELDETSEGAVAESQELLQEGKVQEALDESDTEGLTSCLVQLATPGPRSKLHLPLEDYVRMERVPTVLPKCGARGKYEIVKADDALDAHQELCWRCCPAICKTEVCTKLCEYVALGRGNVVLRCVRRCALGPEGSDSHTHKCLVHSS